MSFLSHSRRQRALEQDQDCAWTQSKASPVLGISPPSSSRWSSRFRRRNLSRTASRETPISQRPPELPRLSRPHSLHSLREILHSARDRSDPSSEQLIRRDYSAYHTQTPPQASVQSRVWDSTGPPPFLRHEGDTLSVEMTSSDKWTAPTDDAHVNTTPNRQAGSIELQRRAVHGVRPSSTYSLFGPTHDPYSEAVADHNLGRHNQQIGGAYRASLDTPQGRQYHREEGRRHSLSHKPDYPDLRQPSTGSPRAGMGFFKRNHDKERKLKSSHGEKPLHSIPNGGTSHIRNTSERSPGPQLRDVAADAEGKAPRSHDSGIHNESSLNRESPVNDSEHPVDLTGIVDLNNTVDTDVVVTHAPAVTHETRHVNAHEIVQEVITREIHNHHVYHRVLPILDYEVLPPRHFTPAEGGGLVEITEDQIPGGANGRQIQQAIANAIANVMPKAQYPAAPRQFTARKFEGTEGDYKEYTGSDGVKRTEQWWVHPPTLETDKTWTGPTVPFHLHSDSPEMDGFRDVLLDRSSDPQQQLGVRHDKPTTKRFPPPRGASLGNTSPAVNGNASAPMVLPIRMDHGDVGQSAKPPGVGVAY